MLIEVVFVVNNATQSHKYTCTNASRQIGVDGANIIFRDGSGRDHTGRKVLSAQYRTAEVIITYDEGETA